MNVRNIEGKAHVGRKNTNTSGYSEIITEEKMLKLEKEIKDLKEYVIPIINQQQEFIEFLEKKGYNINELNIKKINIPNRTKNDLINKKRKVMSN